MLLFENGGLHVATTSMVVLSLVWISSKWGKDVPWDGNSRTILFAGEEGVLNEFPFPSFAVKSEYPMSQ